MSDTIRHLPVTRLGEAGPASMDDAVAVEAPLEVRLGGEPFAVIMRTPGADVDLVLGFLLTEGVIASASDVAVVAPASSGETIDVTLAPARAAAAPAWLGSRRQVAMHASCGMCGRRSLEALEIDDPPLVVDWQVPAALITTLPAHLLAAQPTFEATGGLHAAGLFDLDGRLVASAEDVGRHNAVDKLLGRMLRQRALPLAASLLFVSGRSSFEIVQKAFCGGIPLVASVSAPSTLAVELADQCGITLAGFARDGRYNVYAHRERLVLG